MISIALAIFAQAATPAPTPPAPPPPPARTMTKADFQAQQTRKYERYDVSKDGTVTAEELMQVRPARMDGTPYTIESTRKSLMKRDANGDGKVSIAEAVASEMSRFDKMDANKDGKVTPEERTAEPK